jgi:AcrR family transcriptional regulator
VSSSSPTPRRRAPAAERRAQILDAAMRCFGEQGYHVATMDDLARAAGLSKGSLYWHFRSKEDLLLGLFEAFSQDVVVAFAELEESQAPVIEGLAQIGSATIDRLGAALPLTRAWLEFLSHAEARQRMARDYQQVRECLGRVLSRAVARGEIRAVHVEGTAAGFLAAVEGLLIQAFVDPAFDARVLWPRFFQAFIEGLAPQESTGGPA